MTNKQYFTMIQVRNALNQIADKMAEDNWKPNVIMGINRGGCIRLSNKTKYMKF